MADDSRLEADRRKALGLAIAQIEKQLGKGSIMRMGSESPKVKVGAIPTGAINLDGIRLLAGVDAARVETPRLAGVFVFHRSCPTGFRQLIPFVPCHTVYDWDPPLRTAPVPWPPTKTT